MQVENVFDDVFGFQFVLCRHGFISPQLDPSIWDVKATVPAEALQPKQAGQSNSINCAKNPVSVVSNLRVAVSKYLRGQIEIEGHLSLDADAVAEGHFASNQTQTLTAAFAILKIFNLKPAL